MQREAKLRTPLLNIMTPQKQGKAQARVSVTGPKRPDISRKAVVKQICAYGGLGVDDSVVTLVRNAAASVQKGQLLDLNQPERLNTEAQALETHLKANDHIKSPRNQHNYGPLSATTASFQDTFSPEQMIPLKKRVLSGMTAFRRGNSGL